MSYQQHCDSPDHRYYILLTAQEMRMSHLVENATLWAADGDTSGATAIGEIGGPYWSANQVAWRLDSALVAITLRRYPGDVPSVQVEIDPGGAPV